MKNNDITVGLLTFIIGVFLFITSFSYHPLPGQAYGAGTMPLFLGVGGSCLGAGIVFNSFFINKTRLFKIEKRSFERKDIKAISPLCAIVFLVLTANELGFLMSGTMVVLFLMLMSGVRLLLAILFSTSATIVIYLSFSKLLLVPLPRGILENIVLTTLS
jgi:putative tricarboxylic transport membrane protein